MGKPTFDDWNSEALCFGGNPDAARLRNSSYHMKVSSPEYIGV
jgi:hypothetical protein